MTTCKRLSDRMVEVAHGRSDWSAEEARHLRACPDCEREWAIVAAGARIAGAHPIDADRVAAMVAARLAAEPARGHPRRRWLIGLPIAAALAFALLRTRPETTVTPPAASAASASVLPELDDLSTEELQMVLDVIEPATEEPGEDDPAGLEDLTTQELERILRSLEG